MLSVRKVTVVWLMSPEPECCMLHLNKVATNLLKSLQMPLLWQDSETQHGHDSCSYIEPSKRDSLLKGANERLILLYAYYTKQFRII